MRLLIILLFFVIRFGELQSCTCKTISQYDEFFQSENVVIGVIVDSNEAGFVVRIQEWLKEPTEGLIELKYDNCSISPELNSTWVIYYSLNAENSYRASVCGWSSNLQSPSHMYLKGIAPPPKEVMEDKSNLVLYDFLTNQSVLNNLKQSLDKLRYNRNLELSEQSTSSEAKTKWAIFTTLFLVSVMLIITIARWVFIRN